MHQASFFLNDIRLKTRLNSIFSSSLLFLGGELFEYILAHRYLKEKDAKRFFAQLISSVQYMHKRKIVHRDLKLVSIIYTSTF